MLVTYENLPEKILLDSSVIIGYLFSGDRWNSRAGPLVARLFRDARSGRRKLFYNCIVEAETWPVIPERRQGSQRWMLGNLLSVMELPLLIDSRIAKKAAFLTNVIRQQNPTQDHVLTEKVRDGLIVERRSVWKLADGLIAASAAANDVAIVVADGHFDSIRDSVEVPVIQLWDIVV